MGAVDLVIQVESPKSVTAGLQRIGRAGPRRRRGLARAHLPEVPRRPARVRGRRQAHARRRHRADRRAAQPARRARPADRRDDAPSATSGRSPSCTTMVRRAYPFAELSRELLDSVLDMLDGRYPSEEFAELRPRIVWDRVEDTIRARKGALQLAVTNAGTIPDRGLYGVHLPDGRRVGELDEEMVYEARPGQTFLLGASTWRIEEITRDRVIVTPAPGAPGAVPFWRGDGVGRPKELGEAIGAFAREAVDREPGELAAEYDLDERAARNLSAFLREQRDATRVVPSDRTIVIERFRDEIGDWRLCVLSPFGGRVHAAWALALSARIRDEFGLESDAIWSDDGIIVHLPDADEPPGAELVLVEPDELEELVVRELSGSALFGARFRENAARALLLPRAYPGKRTPLWQQRLKAQSLLEVAKRYGQFPIVLETYRECLRDVFDLPGLDAPAARPAHARAVAGRGGDAARLPVRLVAAVRLRRDLHVRGRHAQRRAARRGAVARPRPAARAARPGGAARADRPGRAGGGRGRPAAHERAHARRQRRLAARRAARARRPDGRRGAGALPRAVSAARMLERARGERRAVRDADRRRGALGRRRGRRPLPRRVRRGAAGRAAGGVPRGGRGAARAARAPLRAHARAVHDARGRRAATGSTSGRCCASWSAPATWCAASCGRAAASASGATRRCCGGCGAPRWRRCARRSSRPSSGRWRASCRPGRAWTRAPPGGAGIDRLREVLVPLQGVALAPEVWERDVLPRRVGAYSPAWMDQLCAGGELVWVGAGALGRRSGRVALYFRDDARWLGPPPFKGERPDEPGARGDPRAARARRGVLDRPAGGRRRHRAGRAAGGALGPGLGGRGDQRRVRAAARAAAHAGRSGERDARPPLRPPPPARRAADPGPLVADRRRCSRTPRPTGHACARWPRCCSSATAS